MNRNEECWCGSGLKYKRCHMPIEERIAEAARAGHETPGRELLKTPEQMAGIRRSAQVNTGVLEHVAARIRPGMTTREIDELVEQYTRAHGAAPAPLGYNGFPKSVCTSINDQVCHGIPDETVLEEGDIVNVDVSTILDGYFSDASRMFEIGNVAPEAHRLVEVARECMEVGVAALRPWGFLGDMGEAVHEHARRNGYSIVREIGGHGIGLEFHEEPFVSYVSRRGTEMLLAPGMIFTIEPMVNAGGPAVVIDAENEWTVYTEDGALSAQWECMVLMTEEGPEILTA